MAVPDRELERPDHVANDQPPDQQREGERDDPKPECAHRLEMSPCSAVGSVIVSLRSQARSRRIMRRILGGFRFGSKARTGDLLIVRIDSPPVARVIASISDSAGNIYLIDEV